MTKWTPSITGFVPVTSLLWNDFTNRMWYGELEFFFTTFCGLLVSITAYYGRTSEENSMALDAEKQGNEPSDGMYTFHVSEVHELFVKHTVPQLLSGMKESGKPAVAKEMKRATENDYRNKHSQRMSHFPLSLTCSSRMVNAKNDTYYMSYKHSQSSTSPIVKENEAEAPSLTDEFLSRIPDFPSDLDVAPVHPMQGSLEDGSISLPRHKSSINVMDNTTASFSSSVRPLPRSRTKSDGTVDTETSTEYLESIGNTITKTWLMIYSTIIRILNLLVSISLSYEKHALSFLRALSVIALAICCEKCREE